MSNSIKILPHQPPTTAHSEHFSKNELRLPGIPGPQSATLTLPVLVKNHTSHPTIPRIQTPLQKYLHLNKHPLNLTRHSLASAQTPFKASKRISTKKGPKRRKSIRVLVRHKGKQEEGKEEILSNVPPFVFVYPSKYHSLVFAK